jgi:hypothetical protein
MWRRTRRRAKAVVAGKSHESSMIERVFSSDPDEVMPTPKSNRKLTAAQKQLAEAVDRRWREVGQTLGV